MLLLSCFSVSSRRKPLRIFLVMYLLVEVFEGILTSTTVETSNGVCFFGINKK